MPQKIQEKFINCVDKNEWGNYKSFITHLHNSHQKIIPRDTLLNISTLFFPGEYFVYLFGEKKDLVST